MESPPPNNPNLFQDSIICGAIGLGIGYVLGRNLFVWALLCTTTGPVFILWLERAIRALPVALPGKYSGAYEFAAFALVVAIIAAFDPFGA